MISANGLCRAYTNQGESLIRYLAHGHLLNGFSGPYLLCVHPELTESLLEELHEDERMQGYLGQVKCLQLKLDSFDLLHVPRIGNAHDDSLAMIATSLA